MQKVIYITIPSLIVLALLLAGCAGAISTTPTPTTGAAPSPTLAPATVQPAASPATATATVEPTLPPTPLPPTEPPAIPTATPTPLPPAEVKGNADVLHVRAVQSAGGSWTFHVTVEHPDTGWQDYADGWDVVLPDGTVLKPDPASPFTRLLLHPHEAEQPFTRSQSGITIPAGVTQVRVRAHDLVDGFGGREIVVDLTLQSGEGFEVERNP